MSDIQPLKQWIYRKGIGKVAKRRTDSEVMLSELEQFISCIFDSSADGISILDSSLVILGVNHAMKRWYSRSDGILGRKCHEVYHNRRSPCGDCPTLRALETGKVWSSVVPYETTDGTMGTQELSAFPLFDDRGGVVGVIENVRDVTRERNEEQVIRDLKRRLRFQHQTLEEQEVALSVLMKRGQRRENRKVKTLLNAVDRIVNPHLDLLEAKLTGTPEVEEVRLIRSCLEDLVSPFLAKVMLPSGRFTRRETQVADLVQRGRSTKEIAELLGITPKGVDFHRMNIRRKLQISGQPQSLQDHLSQL
ncbi:MAG TPA: PAS domain-containing protein [Spirochaetia bacterium]|nr:PAS domain-containing protein [Spirochaetia bacterium]